MTYSTPMLVVLGALMIVIAVLVGIEPWMVGLAAVIAFVMYLVERRKA